MTIFLRFQWTTLTIFTHLAYNLKRQIFQKLFNFFILFYFILFTLTAFSRICWEIKFSKIYFFIFRFVGNNWSGVWDVASRLISQLHNRLPHLHHSCYVVRPNFLFCFSFELWSTDLSFFARKLLRRNHRKKCFFCIFCFIRDVWARRQTTSY